MSATQKYLNRLAGDHVLVIGGSAGIGYGVAEACVEEGCAVYISASSPASAKRTFEKITSTYPSARDRIKVFHCDLADEATLESNVERLFAEVTQNGTQKLDHVVYTAADPLAVIKLEDATLSSVKKAGMTRFFAPLLVAKQVQIHANKSHKTSYTITTGSVSQRPIPDWSVIGSYAGGHHSMARGLALDMRPIRVNTVSPGLVDTGLWRMGEEEKKKFFEEMAKKTTTGRIGNVEDVVHTYLGVLKDRNVSGSVVETNSGGLLL